MIQKSFNIMPLTGVPPILKFKVGLFISGLSVQQGRNNCSNQDCGTSVIKYS